MVDLVIIPRSMALGFVGGPAYATSIVPLSQGREQRVQMWPRPRWQFTFDFTGRTQAEIAEVQTFHIGQAGRAHAFLLYDFIDNALVDEPIGIGGSTDQEFACIKSYDNGNGRPFQRPILYIDDTTLVVKVGGIVDSGATFEQGTGIVTLSAPHPGETDHVVTVSATFYVPVRFSTDQFQASADAPFTGYGSVRGLGALEVIDEAS